MFEIGWSELLVVGIVALLVVGPKELPALLRTIGRYAGMMRRQANEFRAQFDEAMREAELDQLKKDVENIKSEAESTLRSAEHSVTTEFAEAKRELEVPHDPAIPTSTPALTPPPTQVATEAIPASPPTPPAAVASESVDPPAAPKPSVNGSAHGLNGKTAPTGDNADVAKGGA